MATEPVTLLERLRELQAEYATEVAADAVHDGMLMVTPTRHALITTAVDALPAVVALIEAAQALADSEVKESDPKRFPTSVVGKPQLGHLRETLSAFVSTQEAGA